MWSPFLALARIKMAANNKLKTLCVMKILMEMTDDQNTLTAVDIVRELDERFGIKVDRKSIYADIETLMDFGIDIIQNKGTNPGYYVASREFELPELKLLVDAVQSSKFITQKKSNELIEKIERLTCDSQAKQLQRQVFVYNRIKAENETIYYNVDIIHEAIYNQKQIAFTYVEWTPDKRQVPRKDGAMYEVSPWALTWDDENYYLVGYEASTDKIKHYRVDKMRSIALLEKKREGAKQFKNFDLPTYAKKTFGMYGGYDEKVTLICKNHLAGVILDRFGKQVTMIRVDDEHFKAICDVTVSPHFFGWLVSIGSDMRIDGPQKVRDEFVEHVKSMIE